MDKVKEIISILFGSQLLIQGQTRTFVKAPMWLAVLAGLSSLWLAALSALIVVGFGMKASIVKN